VSHGNRVRAFANALLMSIFPNDLNVD